MLQKGDKVKDFSLPDKNGNMVTLSEVLKEKKVVVFFYPKNFSNVCTKESCAFRDDYESFLKKDAEVIGISHDTEKSHEEFASKYKLPFILLSDKKGEVRRLFGVPKILGLITTRATFVIDKDSTILKTFSTPWQYSEHISEALSVL
jgi:thioredoxin-dependent peroxiredoxin